MQNIINEMDAVKFQVRSVEVGERDSTSVTSEKFELSESIRELKNMLWSIEEMLYMNSIDDHTINSKKEMVLEKLSNVVNYFISQSEEFLVADCEKEKLISKIQKEYEDFFEALKLAKKIDYVNCINHESLFPFFHFLMNVFKNRSVNTINDVGIEIFSYVLKKKKESFENNNIFVLHLMVCCLLQFKLLLCATVLLNLFIQQNCTGPILDLQSTAEDTLMSADIENDKERPITLKTFLNVLCQMNECYSQSCFEILSLEGEYIYEKCQFLNCFCITIILLDVINTYDKDSFSFFEDHDMYFYKNYKEEQCITNAPFFREVLQTYTSIKRIFLEKVCEVFSLYYFKSKFLWVSRIYFIWQRLFTSNSIYYHFLRVHVLDKPLNTLVHLKLVLDEILPKGVKECEKLEEYVPCTNVLSNMDQDFIKIFYPETISNDLKIYVLSNYAMYLAYYNDVHGYNIALKQISLFSKFQWTFTGRMGIRRKYQKHPVSLLVLKTSMDGIEDETDSIYLDVCPSSIYDILKSSSSVLDIERDCENYTAIDNGNITEEEEGITEKSNATGKNTCSISSIHEGCEGERKTWKLKELDPDTDILEEPFFLDSQNNKYRVLTFQEQIILINKCYSYTQFFPESDPITYEEMSALISRCLKSYDVNIKKDGMEKSSFHLEQSDGKNKQNEREQKIKERIPLQKRFQNWLLQSCLLLFKSRVEFTRYKTKDRANKQLNELIKEYAKEKPSEVERMLFAYDVYYPYQWDLKKQVGKRMVDSGNMMTAFHIYKSLNLWEDAVSCLIAAGRNGEALELLDEISEGNRTPCIICLYGMADPKNSHKFFEESWKISNEKYAKAGRLLGTYYYNANEYEKCCYYLEKALEISPLYPDAHFMLGCAYMQKTKYIEAIKAFTRMVAMPNADCHKAWGNLAFIYINLNKFESAQICITHALKSNFNNWKYWDTFLKIAVCQQDIDNSCLALKHLCEMGKAKFIDSVVFRFYFNVISNRSHIEKTKKKEYVDKITNMMKLVAQYMGVNLEFWKIYFALTAELGDHDEALNLCIRSLRSVQTTLESVSDVEKRKELLKQHCTDIVELLNKLSFVINEYFPNESYPDEPFLKHLEKMRQNLENINVAQTVIE